jgi:hypothetical protein
MDFVEQSEKSQLKKKDSNKDQFFPDQRLQDLLITVKNNTDAIDSKEDYFNPYMIDGREVPNSMKPYMDKKGTFDYDKWQQDLYQRQLADAKKHGIPPDNMVEDHEKPQIERETFSKEKITADERYRMLSQSDENLKRSENPRNDKYESKEHQNQEIDANEIISEKIEIFQKNHRNENCEFCEAYDSNTGDTIYKARGGDDYVKSPPPELVKGNDLIHNHPKGSPFSLDDYNVISKSDGRSVRVVGDKYIYNLERPSDKWVDNNQISDIYKKYKNDPRLQQYYLDQIHDGKLTIHEANIEFQNTIWENIVKESDGKVMYKREKIG